MKVKSESEVTQSYPTISDPMDCSLPGSSVHGDSPSKNTGVASLPSSRGSSQPRNQACMKVKVKGAIEDLKFKNF